MADSKKRNIWLCLPRLLYLSMPCIALGIIFGLSIPSNSAHGEMKRSPYPEERVYSGYKIQPFMVRSWQPNLKSKPRKIKLTPQMGVLKNKNLVLIPVFTSCPVTCPTILKDFEGLLANISRGPALDPKKFQVVVASFDPADSIKSFESLVVRQKLPQDWLYVVPASRHEFKKFEMILTDLDFRYQKLPSGGGGFAHPAGAYIFDRQGIVKRFLAQSEFTPEDVASAIDGEAKSGNGPTGKSATGSRSGGHHSRSHSGHMGHN